MIARHWEPFSFSHEETKAWENLLANSPSDPVFGSWEWARAWMEHLSSGNAHMVQLLEDGKPAGMAPLVLEIHKWGGVSANVLSPMGWSTGEYVDLPVAGKEAWSVLFKYLLDARGWDVLSFRRMPSSADNARDLVLAAQSLGLGIIKEEEQICPFLDLDHTLEDYLKSRFRSKFRNRIRRMSKRLSSMGKHRFEMVHDPESMEKVLGAIADLEARSWKGAQGKGVFQEPPKQRFYFQVAQALAAKEMVALHLQWLDDRLLAYHYGFVAGGRYHDFSLSFDPEFGNYSPGLLSLVDLLGWCYDQGLARFDFLRGAEKYKAQWTDTATQNANIHVFFPKAKARALQAGLSLRLKARKVKRQFFPREEEAVFRVVGSDKP